MGKSVRELWEELHKQRAMDEWEESKHKRAKNGQFASTAGGGSNGAKVEKALKSDPQTRETFKKMGVASGSKADKIIQSSDNPKTAAAANKMKEFLAGNGRYMSADNAKKRVRDVILEGLKDKSGYDNWRLPAQMEDGLQRQVAKVLNGANQSKTANSVKISDKQVDDLMAYADKAVKEYDPAKMKAPKTDEEKRASTTRGMTAEEKKKYDRIKATLAKEREDAKLQDSVDRVAKSGIGENISGEREVFADAPTGTEFKFGDYEAEKMGDDQWYVVNTTLDEDDDGYSSINNTDILFNTIAKTVDKAHDGLPAHLKARLNAIEVDMVSNGVRNG